MRDAEIEFATREDPTRKLFPRGVENTNMTDRISSLQTLLYFGKDDIIVPSSMMQEYEAMSTVNRELKDKNDELELLLAHEKRDKER